MYSDPDGDGLVAEFPPIDLKKLTQLDADSAIEMPGNQTDSAPVETRWVKTQGAEKAGSSQKNAPMEEVASANAHEGGGTSSFG